MFRRVNLEAWHNLVPYICFAIIAGVFIVIVVRALRMKQSDVDRIASLPLRDDNEAASVEPTPSEKSHE
ncbi:MAG: hypothetical protein P1U87_22510 [Verrucomicrobiales bacterium]|nr:hypothetical protein [Verrucomicrobiales bacterium]